MGFGQEADAQPGKDNGNPVNEPVASGNKRLFVSFHFSKGIISPSEN